MALVVVGGHSRNVGKTSVVAGLIAALPERSWTAMKITQFGHGICSANGELCDCSTGDHSVAISEERSRANDTDTSRFLVAGAKKVWWVRTEQGRLAEAMPRVREIIEDSDDCIIESNSVMRFVRPDIYVAVLDPANEDFKESARAVLDRATIVLIHAADDIAWRNVSLKPVQGRPIFRISSENYLPKDAIEFVRQLLESRQSAASRQGSEGPKETSRS